jgi:hypothetical protein
MVSRRRRLGKYVQVRFAEPPWNEEHPDWIRLAQELPAAHLARQMVDAMQVLNLEPLFASYGAGGTPPLRPDLMLRVVLIEMQQGRFRPAQWFRDAREQTPLLWASQGLRPSRTCWYDFADRLAPFLDDWNRQAVSAARQRETTPATRGAQDGSAVAANASRHRLVNEQRLTARCAALESACGADEIGQNPKVLPGWMAKTPATRKKQRERFEKAQVRLRELHAINDRQDAARRRPREKIVVSLGDPEAALGRDKLHVFRPLYNVQLVLDLDSPLILGYDVFAQSGDEGTLKPMLKRLRQTFGVHLKALLVDSAYVTACNLALSQRYRMNLYGPWQENDCTAQNKKPPKQFPKSQFSWHPEENAYRCPQGHPLTWIGKQRRPQSDGEIHTMHSDRCHPEHCRVCPQRSDCTTNPHRGRSVKRSAHEELINAHKARMQTEETKALYKLRRQTVELAFADAKQHRNQRALLRPDPRPRPPTTCADRLGSQPDRDRPVTGNPRPADPKIDPLPILTTRRTVSEGRA